MISYKDKTFCVQGKCVKWDCCPDALTEEVIEKAHEWWGSSEAPISCHSGKPPCYEEGDINEV